MALFVVVLQNFVAPSIWALAGFCSVGRGSNWRECTVSQLSLTARETQVADLVCRGLTNREIAQLLGLSEASVKQKLHNVYKKVGVSKRAGLIRDFFAGNRSEFPS
jgi:DNA-binding NarL/FixJ family response regulator